MEWIQEITERFFVFVVSQIICVPFLKWPFQDLAHPERAYDMENAMNVRINVARNERIGAWFLQPIGTRNIPLPRSDEEQYYDSHSQPLVDKDETVILYLHGNSHTRSQYHRRTLYRLFQKMGYYVLAIDYRGYADSTWLSPSQTSLVADAKAAFDWLSERSHPSANIFIWGHSLGTGVTSKLGSILDSEERVGGRRATGYILESPFNRMEDEVKSFRISRIIPFLGFDIAQVLSRADMAFDSAQWIKRIDEPILILHAEDDHVIPVHLAQKLHDDAMAPTKDVAIHIFGAEQRLAHKDIFLAKEPLSISHIVTNFVSRVLRSKL